MAEPNDIPIQGLDAGEFYVGYLPNAPRAIARFARWSAAVIVLLALCASIAVAVAQKDFDSGRFEFGVQRTFEGVLLEQPVPALYLTDRLREGSGGMAWLVLVGAGKHGPPPEIAGHHGERVQFSGSLIHRRGMTMVELNDPGSFKSLGNAVPSELPAPGENLGEVILSGEVVDTKCFFGVMRHASGKIHRACAIRCLSGGVPPGLWVRGPEGQDVVFLLAGEGEEPLDLDPQLAGLVLEVVGKVEWQDGFPVLRVKSFRQLTFAGTE